MKKPVSVSIHVPIFYRSDSNEEWIDVQGCRTVGECLDHLIRRYPEMKKMLYTGKGTLQTWVGIYLNGVDAHPDELARPVKDGDEIRVFLYLSV